MKLQFFKNSNLLKSLVALVFISSMWACKPDKNGEDVLPAPAALDESAASSLMVSDAVTNDVTMVYLREGKVEKMQVANPKSYIYSTDRYIYSIQRDQNQLQFLDTGLDAKGNGKPTMLSKKMDMKLPTHFYASGDYGIIFNDGDGTVGLVNVANLAKGNESDSKIINFGGAIHHGAAAMYDNGTIAVTDKEGNVPGALPQKVVIIDQTGKRVFTNAVTVTGIHGEASNGKVALFGSTNGVIAVNQDGTARLIPYPASLTNTSGNWLGTIAGNKKTPFFLRYCGKARCFQS
jgi:hypothetical protein